MQINEVTATPRFPFLLTEDIGTLSQLNAGPLINVLKQEMHGGNNSRSSRYNRGPYVSPDRKKFVNAYNIGAKSEIVDLGAVKNIADVRKAYRSYDNMKGFALYIGNVTALLAIYDSYDIAGRTREGKVAWDLTPFKEAHEAQQEKAAAEKGRWNYNRLSTTSITDKEEPDYDAPDYYKQDPRPVKIVHYTGTLETVDRLSALIDIAKNLADEFKMPLTMKGILQDVASQKLRMSRQDIKYQLSQTGDSLAVRLAKYKNSKKPTAKNIQEFVMAVLSKSARSIQFAGDTYSTSTNDELKIRFEDLLRGKTFDIDYKSLTPGRYGGLKITYAYANDSLTPVSASYTSYTDTNQRGESVTDIINPELYAKIHLGVKDLNDKDEIIRKILTSLKDQSPAAAKKLLNITRKLGHTWPELDRIEKAIEAEIEKQRAAA